jgi:hypothetical protein
MINHTIDSENSEHHWAHMETTNKILIDLGCGRHGTDILNQSSSIYLGEKGATRVIGVDASQSEINYFNENNPNPEKYLFLCRFIDSPEIIKSLISEYSATAIKCDIEGHEQNFYSLTKEDMENIEELSIEYHDYHILDRIKEKIQEWGFSIHAEGKFGFVDAPQMGVLFTRKIV